MKSNAPNSNDCGHFNLTKDGYQPIGATHRHTMNREVCPTCGMYFINCDICHPFPRCPDCFDKSFLRSHPLADLTDYSQPAPQADLPPAINYCLVSGHSWNPVIVFHVDDAEQSAHFAIDQDGYLLQIEKDGRAYRCTGHHKIVIE